MAVTMQPAKTGFIHGWMVVFAAFVAFSLVYGTVLYSFTAFVNPVAKTFGATVAQVQLAFAATNVGTGILGIFGGMLLSRYSKRLCIVVGLAILAVSFYGLSLATQLWQFIALYGIAVAFGASLAAPMGASAIVNNWFIKNRGRALTFATLGTSFGQLVIPKYIAGPIMAAYGSRAIPRLAAAVRLAKAPWTIASRHWLLILQDRIIHERCIISRAAETRPVVEGANIGDL